MQTRSTAALLLAEVIRDGQSLTPLQRRAADELADNQVSLLKNLTFSVCRFYWRYLAVLDQLMDKPFRPKDTDLLALVMIAMHQLTDPEQADHAVIHQTVTATDELNKGWARGLVNALLRNWQRQLRDKQAPWHSDLRYQSAHPGWLTKRIRRDWPHLADDILAAGNLQAPMWIRVNLNKCSRDEYLALLRHAEIEAEPGELVPEAIRLITPRPVHDLPEFEEGWCSVQDQAAQLAARLLEARPNDKVLDACCAPGGKTGHLLELGCKNVVAADLVAERMERVTENMDRLGLSAQLVIADLSQPDWWQGEDFDRILLDAPCSATGVIRRHPDIKLLRRAEDIKNLANLQRQILINLWGKLKTGGTLLYVTCSILKAENEDNIRWFVEQHPEAQLLPLPDELNDHSGQLIPGQRMADGFYFARLKKTEMQA